MDYQNDLVLLLEQYRNDIPFFVQQAFGTTLNAKQVEFVTKYQTNTQITFRGGIGFGKTFSMAVLIHWALITHNDVQITIFGPAKTRSKRACGRRWATCTRSCPRISKNTSNTQPPNFTASRTPLGHSLKHAWPTRTTWKQREASTRGTTSCLWTKPRVCRMRCSPNCRTSSRIPIPNCASSATVEDEWLFLRHLGASRHQRRVVSGARQTYRQSRHQP